MIEASPPPYPWIEPTTFDLIIVGTGLSQSIIAAAASTAGKSVLHLDPNPFYGSHFASLSLPELTSFLHSHSIASSTSPADSTTSSDCTVINITTRPVYSNIDISPVPPDLEDCRKLLLDVSGPRVFFCADSAVNLLRKSGVSEYLEFKSIDESFVFDENRNLWNVPESRAKIFKDMSLGLIEKNRLMKFFNLVQTHLQAVAAGEDSGEKDRISDEDLESPFVEFLTEKGLPPKIKSAILYAIAMADYDQEEMDANGDLLKTSDGINRLALYHSSIGIFGNEHGAMIYPKYGQGEIPQAFCRRAAVKGCLYVLRMPVVALLVDKGNGSYKGIKLSSGQNLSSNQLLLDPGFVIPQTSIFPSRNSSPDHVPRNCNLKVARGICITNKSLKPDVSSFFMVFPPRSLYPEQVMSIRAVQLGSDLAICPPDMFLVYLSSLCNDASQGKTSIGAAIDALFTLSAFGSAERNILENSETTSALGSNDSDGAKPNLLWSAQYIQEVMQGSCQSISLCPSPDGSLIYNGLIEETLKILQKMYPDEEFFVEKASSEDPEKDAP